MTTDHGDGRQSDAARLLLADFIRKGRPAGLVATLSGKSMPLRDLLRLRLEAGRVVLGRPTLTK